MLTPFLSSFNSLKPVTSTLPTKSNKTTNTHQFSLGNCNVVKATTNSNNMPITILKIRVMTECILKILMYETIKYKTGNKIR